MSYGILFLRLVLGLIVAAHGAQKLFGFFGGYGLRWSAGFFTNLGFRGPLAMALVVGLSEMWGGLFLAAGFLTPVAGLAIATVMVTAIASVHWRNGFWNTSGGYEFNLLIGVSAVALAAAGGGRYSLDAVLGLTDAMSGLRWGLGVLAGSVLLSVLILVLGRPGGTTGIATASLEVEATEQDAAGSGRSGAVAIDPSSGIELNPPVSPLEASGLSVPVRDTTIPADPVEIEVEGPGDGTELIDCLWAYGFPAKLVESAMADRWRVEVCSPRSDSHRALLDLVVALEDWLLERGRRGLMLRVGERRYAMSPTPQATARWVKRGSTRWRAA